MNLTHMLMAAVLATLPSGPVLPSGQDAASAIAQAPSAHPNQTESQTPSGQASNRQFAKDPAKRDSPENAQPTSGQPKDGQPAKQHQVAARPHEKKVPASKPVTPKALPPTLPTGVPRKIVVREGSTPEPTAQIVPGLTEEQAKRQRQVTEGLLDSTERSLRRLGGRTLSGDQQETVGQVRSFIAGAHSALERGDTQRARNLAQKAYLLSDDLMKH